MAEALLEALPEADILETEEAEEAEGAVVTAAARPTVQVGFPGPSGCIRAFLGLLATGQHCLIRLRFSDADHNNFNNLWAGALNDAEAGHITHFVMLHTDTFPSGGWVDVLYRECQRLGVGLLSVPNAIKDSRGLSSCGIGNPDNPWAPLRRFTFKELAKFPETFTAADAGYPGGILLHNNACWIADLRHPAWGTVDPTGALLAGFYFPMRVCRDRLTGKWVALGESEDWYFSRRVHELGIPSAITRKIKLWHRGQKDYPNFGEWGDYEHDEDTRATWDESAQGQEGAA